MNVRGKGTIFPLEDKPNHKCRKWQLRVSAGRDLATGKYRRINRNFAGTKSEAQAALRELIKELEGRNKPTGKVTYGQYSDYWLEKTKDKVAPNTHSYYSRIIKTGRLHLSYASLDDITYDVMETIYKKLLDGQTLSGKPASSKTVRHFATMHHSMFKQAIKDGVITHNPCDLAEVPPVEIKERKVVPAEKLADLIDKLDPSNAVQFAIRLILRLGLRRGEAAALCIKDFNFEKRIIRVEKSVDKYLNVGAPKTQAGVRSLPLPPVVEDDFKIRKEAIEEDFKRVKSETGVQVILDENTPLLCNEIGLSLNPECIRRWWERNRDAFGFSDITVHDLRHSYLTAMARKKIDPKLLQKLAGHAKYTTTMQIYVHVDDDDLRAAVELMDW